jgi:hypothetical protein
MVVARTMNTLAGRFSDKHVEIYGFSGQATEIHWFYFPQWGGADQLNCKG